MNDSKHLIITILKRGDSSKKWYPVCIDSAQLRLLQSVAVLRTTNTVCMYCNLVILI